MKYRLWAVFAVVVSWCLCPLPGQVRAAPQETIWLGTDLKLGTPEDAVIRNLTESGYTLTKITPVPEELQKKGRHHIIVVCHRKAGRSLAIARPWFYGWKTEERFKRSCQLATKLSLENSYILRCGNWKRRATIGAPSDRERRSPRFFGEARNAAMRKEAHRHLPAEIFETGRVSDPERKS